MNPDSIGSGACIFYYRRSFVSSKAKLAEFGCFSPEKPSELEDDCSSSSLYKIVTPEVEKGHREGITDLGSG